ncbi:MAG: ABC transporter ATP-binding protein [Firmicutes bacterium]|nr:ABC transporter ATP-binding protein [Bacillota bacterium]
MNSSGGQRTVPSAAEQRIRDFFPPRPGGGGRRFGMMLPAEKPKNFRKTVRRLASYLRPHGLKLLFVFILAVSGVIMNVVSPKILGRATTIIFTGMQAKAAGTPGAAIDFARIGQILRLLLLLYAGSAFCRYFEHYIMAGISQKTIFDLRSDVSAKLVRLPLKYYDANPHGDIMSRLANDIETIGSTLQQSLVQILEAVVTLAGVLALMLTISGWLTLIVLVTLPLSFFVTRTVTRYSQHQFAAQQRELGLLNAHVEEMFGGHLIVKAFNREASSVAAFKAINERLYAAGWRAQFVSGIIMPLLNLVHNMGYILMAVVGAVFVTRGQIQIGDVQAFFQYSRQFNQPILQVANFTNIFQSAIAAAERVFELLDEEEEVPDGKNALAAFSPAGNVSFEKVQFGYAENKLLMQDLNIEVQAGRTVAIVGPTGAGKTTLVNLLMRFYEVSGGRILIDGIDIRDIKRSALRSIFGMVLQDTWLFKGTIRDNIAYGKPEASDEEIYRAARAAQIDHFIRTLPEGYNTVLNEEASNISAGQKQLLTIARAILADPAILILDEATSSVDTRTEILIQRAMQELMKGRTSFVIAHRLSTVRDADLILVLNHGDVVEKGTHAELLAKGGFYAEIYRSQFTSGKLNEAG